MRALAGPAARRPPSSAPSHSLSRTPMVEDGVCTTEDELNSSGSELDEAEQRRELLTDVSCKISIFVSNIKKKKQILIVIDRINKIIHITLMQISCQNDAHL